MFNKVWTHAHIITIQLHNQFNQFMIRDNSYKSRIVLSLIMFKRLLLK